MISTPQQTSSISIIVPTLNEAANLPGLLPAAALAKELIVVDGGSQDGTVAQANAHGFRVLETPFAAGRGSQLNHGAAAATGDILLFLHADTRLPPDFPKAVQGCLQIPQHILGAFRLKLDAGGILLDLIVWAANHRARQLALPYGDQALFMRRDDFMRLGGFPKVPIMEDFLLLKEAKRHGRIAILPQAVTTSARRWQRLGTLHTTLVNQLVILGYYLGISPKRLASFYRGR